MHLMLDRSETGELGEKVFRGLSPLAVRGRFIIRDSARVPWLLDLLQSALPAIIVYIAVTQDKWLLISI